MIIMFLVCHRRVVFIRCVVYRMLTAGIDSSPLLFEGLSTCWSLIKGISSHLFLVRENLASRIFRVSFSFYFFLHGRWDWLTDCVMQQATLKLCPSQPFRKLDPQTRLLESLMWKYHFHLFGHVLCLHLLIIGCVGSIQWWTGAFP